MASTDKATQTGSSPQSNDDEHAHTMPGAPRIYYAPAHQPKSVHELTKRLFSAYTVDGGVVHLAGCRLEDRLFLRLGGMTQNGAALPAVDELGQPIDEGLVRSLGMDETVAWERPPEMPPDRLEEMVRRSTECARLQWGMPNEADLLYVWCKYAEGKLCFTIGEHSADLPFSGWTQTLESPPFICPCSGIASYHIAATDDGRIVAAESIQTCAETGQRVLASELVMCDATGQGVLASQTQVCPVADRPVLRRALVECVMCCQRVSPTVIEDGRCLACRSTQPIAKGEPLLASLLERYEELRRWSRWKASETATVHILVASRWLKRMVLVVDKESGNLCRAAVASRFGGEFSPIELDPLPVEVSS